MMKRLWILPLLLLALDAGAQTLTRTNIAQPQSTGGHGTGGFTSGSFTPNDNSLLVVLARGIQESNGAFGGTDLTITDSESLTWTTQEATDTSPGWAYGAAVFTAPVTTGVSMTVTVDAGAFDIHAYRVEIYDYTNYDTGAPVGGTAIGSDADGEGAASITLSAAPATTSEVLAATTSSPQGGTINVDPGTGWTELFDVVIEGGWISSQTQVRGSSSSDSVDWNDLQTGTAIMRGATLLAVEIQEASAGPTGNPLRRRRSN